MKKLFKKFLTVALAAVFAINFVPVGSDAAEAETSATSTKAYLSFTNSDSSVIYNGATDTKNIAGSTGVDATVTGIGHYTVSFDLSKCKKASGDAAFLGIIIDNGNLLFPNYSIKLDELKINGKAITGKKGYTDDNETSYATRMNIFNSKMEQYFSDGYTNPRSYDGWYGNNDSKTWNVVSSDQIKDIKTCTVTFEFVASTQAHIIYGNSDWSVVYYGTSVTEGATGTNARVYGAGKYTVSFDLSKCEKAAGDAAMMQIFIYNGDTFFPNYYIKLDEVKINGEDITVKKGFTYDQDKTTRINLFNVYAAGMPKDANCRSIDGSLEGVTSNIVSADQLKDVKTVSVTFEYVDPAPSSALTDSVTLSASKSSVTVASGKSLTISYEVSGAEDVTVKTSNKKIVTVKKTEDGKIKITAAKSAKKGAKATVTLTAGDKKVTVKVTVK